MNGGSSAELADGFMREQRLKWTRLDTVFRRFNRWEASLPLGGIPLQRLSRNRECFSSKRLDPLPLHREENTARKASHFLSSVAKIPSLEVKPGVIPECGDILKDENSTISVRRYSVASFVATRRSLYHAEMSN